MPVVLLVEADEAAGAQLSAALADAGYNVLVAHDGLEALRLFYEGRPSVVILSLPVDKMDDLELIRLLHAVSQAPIIVLTEDGDTSFTVRALDTGADDVFSKSSSFDETLARLRAATRRAAQRPEQAEEQLVVQTGDLVIDRANRTVTKRGTPVQLTRTEYRLLDALASRVGQVAPHRFLLSTIWGDAFVEDTHYLRMYIGYLRNKLEDDPSHPQYLLNEWGLGYRLASIAQPRSAVAEVADEPAAPPRSRRRHS